MQTNNYDLIVIGAGPCGVMAAIQATKNHKSVLLIEKNSEVLKKLSISGNGRCNLTNNKEFKDFIKQISNKKFLYSTIKQFDAQAVMKYFELLNIALKEETDNRIFPASNSAKTIINALTSQLNNTNILLNTMVTNVKQKDNLFIVKTKQKIYQARNLLLACGGQTYPKIGVGIDVYSLAQQLGHTITSLRVEECPIKTTPLIKEWQGIALNDVAINVMEDNKSHLKSTGSIIFTHFGLSGPGILNLSFVINKLDHPLISLNLLNQNYEDAKELIYKLVNQNPKKYLKNQLPKYLPQKIVDDILNNLKIFNIRNSYLNKQQLKKLLSSLTDLRLTFKGFYQPEYAFLTGSGINLNEINSKTLESKLVKNLYFGGEILDGCGPLGGYNITIALACGYLVGNNIN